MNLPFISRRQHEQEIETLRRSISTICNTGCRTAKCQGEPKASGKYVHDQKATGRTGHKFAPPGKRVMVTLHNGDQFVAKFKEKTGKFHFFSDHDKVRSAGIRQLSILTTDYVEKESK